MIAILEKLPNIALSQLAYLVVLLIPDSFNDIIPIALVLAVLLTGNQLYSQSEIYILRNSGLNSIQTSLPILVVGLGIGIAMTINASYLKPIASLKLSELTFTITNSNFTDYLVPGEFRELKNLGLTITADDNKDGELTDVFMHNAQTNQVITGQKAYITNNGPFNYTLNIEQGSVLNLTENSLAHTDFKNYHANLSRGQFKARDSVEFYNIVELYQHKGTFPITEMHWRLSRFLYCLALTAIALLFIPKSPRSGTSLAILSGVIMFFIYNRIANKFYSQASKGHLNPHLVFWILYPSVYIGVLGLKAAIASFKGWLFRARQTA